MSAKPSILQGCGGEGHFPDGFCRYVVLCVLMYLLCTTTVVQEVSCWSSSTQVTGNTRWGMGAVSFLPFQRKPPFTGGLYVQYIQEIQEHFTLCCRRTCWSCPRGRGSGGRPGARWWPAPPTPAWSIRCNHNTHQHQHQQFNHHHHRNHHQHQPELEKVTNI